MSTSKLSLETKLKTILENGLDLENKTLFIEGELNENLGSYLRKHYAALKLYWEQEKKKELTDFTLDISSYGGDIYSVYGALDFYEEVKRDNVLVNTRAQGVCMSAATILLCGGTGVRVATKRCKLMLHDIQVGNVEGGTATQIQKLARDLAVEQKELFGFYVEFGVNRGKKPLTQKQLETETKRLIERFASNSTDTYITASEALTLKLVDKIT